MGLTAPPELLNLRPHLGDVGFLLRFLKLQIHLALLPLHVLPILALLGCRLSLGLGLFCFGLRVFVVLYPLVRILFGAALGATFLSHLSGWALEALLSFGCAALLYLVTEELLVEAHEEIETPVQTAMFFLGFIALLVTEMIA